MQLAEIQAALGISKKYSTFAKYEKLHASALGVLSKQCRIIKLRSEKLSIIELNKVTKHSRTYIINKEACFITPVEKKTKEL